MKKNKQKSVEFFSWSKFLTITTLVVFIVCVIIAMLVPTSEISAGVVITASGSITLTCIVWYLKKAQAENIAKIQIQYFKDTTDIRVRYHERMIRLHQKYGIDSEEIDDSELSEICDDAYSEGKNLLNDMSTDAKSMTEPEHLDC